MDLSQEFHPVPKVYKVKKEPKSINKVGKKGQSSLDNVAQRKKEFEAVGITECEIKLKVCWKNNALSFAHLKKRRKLSVEELKIVVLACIPCHDVVEKLPAIEMEKLLQNIIDKRVRQP